MIDIEGLKERVTIGDVLSEFGAALPGARAGWQDWVQMTCPFCPDRNGSASINRQLNRFLCHQCGAPRDGKSGDVIDVVKFELNIKDTRGAIEWLTRTFRL